MSILELWCAALGLVVSPAKQDALGEELRQVEKTLADLSHLHRSLREDGPLPDRAARSMGAATRLEVVAGMDAIQARRLGMSPDRLRSWLLPGFVEELRSLSLELARSQEQAAAPGSGVLTLLLDLETELHREALRNLLRLGLRDPRLALGQDFKQEVEEQIAEGATPPGPASPPGPGEDARPSEAPGGNDPLLAAEAHYRRALYAEALESYQKVDPARNPRIAPQVLYRMGECRRQLGQLSEALECFEKVLHDHPDSPWAPQAQWSSSLVRTLQALQVAGNSREQP